MTYYEALHAHIDELYEKMKKIDVAIDNSNSMKDMWLHHKNELNWKVILFKKRIEDITIEQAGENHFGKN